jgi:hypothetical protein
VRNATGTMTMDHDCSLKTMAVEKYVLGDFGAAERKAFERHYFECESCGEEVRLAFEFKEIATTIFLEEAVPVVRRLPAPAPKRWFAWLNPAALAPLAASLAIAMWGGYQGLVETPALRARLMELNQPQAFQATTVVPPSSRGEEPVFSRSAGPLIRLTLGIGVVPAADRYTCEVRTAGTKVHFRIQIPRLEPDANLTLTIPATGIAPGRYEAVLLGVHGQQATEIDHYPFVVRN